MTRQILLGIDIHGGRTECRDAISTSNGLSSFWTSDSTAEPVVGSEARFGFQGAPMGLLFKIEKVDEGGVGWVCVEGFPFWEGTKVFWELGDDPEANATRLLFSHSGFPEDQPDWDLASVAQTWAKVLERLKILVETGSAEPALG
jgi:hypothetical protein